MRQEIGVLSVQEKMKPKCGKRLVYYQYTNLNLNSFKQLILNLILFSVQFLIILKDPRKWSVERNLRILNLGSVIGIFFVIQGPVIRGILPSRIRDSIPFFEVFWGSCPLLAFVEPQTTDPWDHVSVLKFFTQRHFIFKGKKDVAARLDEGFVHTFLSWW